MEDFSFKNLIVWQKGLDFAENCLDITESIKGHYRICEQLEGSAASIPQNITEGDSRVSVKENIQYLYIARGSLNEAITILNLLSRKGFIDMVKLTELENFGLEIAKMINSLITQKRKFL